MPRAVEFLGRLYYSPGARGAFRAKPQPPGQSADFTTLILIGASENGWYFKDTSVPTEQRIMDFGNNDEALAVLGTKGDLADAIANAFTPSRDQRFANGPQLIRAICVSNNAKASANALTITGDNASIKALIPGPQGNKTRFRVSSQGKVIELGDNANINTSPTLEADDISISYLGDASSAILTLNATELKVELSGQSDASVSFTLLLKDYTSIGELVDVINSKPFFQAIVLSRPDRLTQNLDHYDASESINLSGGASKILSSLFNEQQRFMRGTGLAEIIQPPLKKPIGDMLSFLYLSGGNTATPTPTDWIEAIDFVYANNVEGFFISLCTDSLPVSMHLADKLSFGASPDGSNEKFGTTGLSDQKSINERIDELKLINSEFLIPSFSPVITRQADKISQKQFSGWMMGVIHNAIKASANLREAPTNKDLNIISCPETYGNTEVVRILQAGGMIVTRKPNRGPFKIHFAITSYQKENIILNQSSLICTSMGLVKDFREWLDNTYLGEVPTDPDAQGSALTDADIRTEINNRFKYVYVQQYGWLTRNIYTGESAFNENYTIRRDGDALFFIFPDGKVVSPINFMMFLMNLDVVRGSSNG